MLVCTLESHCIGVLFWLGDGYVAIIVYDVERRMKRTTWFICFRNVANSMLHLLNCTFIARSISVSSRVAIVLTVRRPWPVIAALSTYCQTSFSTHIASVGVAYSSSVLNNVSPVFPPDEQLARSLQCQRSICEYCSKCHGTISSRPIAR